MEFDDVVEDATVNYNSGFEESRFLEKRGR